MLLQWYHCLCNNDFAVLFFFWRSCTKELTLLSLLKGWESKSLLESYKAGAGAHFLSLMTDAEFWTVVKILYRPFWPDDPCKEGRTQALHHLIDAQVLLPPKVLQGALHHGIWRLRRKWMDGMMVSICDKEHETNLYNVWLRKYGFQKVNFLRYLPGQCSGAVWTSHPLAGKAGMRMQGENAPGPCEYVCVLWVFLLLN